MSELAPRYLYLVYSPESMSSDDESKITQFLDTKHSVRHLVLEHGKSGHHPHLNYVLQTNSRPDNVRVSLYRFLGYDKARQRSNRHLIVVKRADDLPQLVCGYLRKEDDAVVICTDLDMAPLEAEYATASRSVSTRYLSINPDLHRVNEEQVIIMFMAFIDEHSLDPTKQSLRSFQREYVKRKFYASRISWKKVLNYVTLRHDTMLADELEIDYEDDGSNSILDI